MAAKKRVKLARTKPRSITIRTPDDEYRMLQDLVHARSVREGRQKSTNSIVLELVREEFSRESKESKGSKRREVA